MIQTVSIVVKGNVQGVYFRQSAKEKALQLEINGTIENSRDGSVSVIASGSSDKLRQLIEWCKRGPARAIVHSVEVSHMDHREFEGFKILR